MVDGHQTVNLAHKKLSRFESYHSHLINWRFGVGGCLHEGLKNPRLKFNS